MATHYIPIQSRGNVVSGPTTFIAIAGIGASAVACIGLSLSGALHLFSGLSAAPVLAEAFVSNRFWLAFWNIAMPCSLSGITVATYLKWCECEDGKL